MTPPDMFYEPSEVEIRVFRKDTNPLPIYVEVH